MTTTVRVDELFASWLSANLPDVGVSSHRPAGLEKMLPWVVVRRSGGGGVWVDEPSIVVDAFAGPPTDGQASPAETVAGQVRDLFRLNTPAGWRGSQFTLRQVNQAPVQVSDDNAAVEQYSAIYTFSLQ